VFKVIVDSLESDAVIKIWSKMFAAIEAKDGENQLLQKEIQAKKDEVENTWCKRAR
jgi:hypothetical protein